MDIFNLPSTFVWYKYLYFHTYFYISTKRLLTKRNSFFLFFRKHGGLQLRISLYILLATLTLPLFLHSFSCGILLKEKIQKKKGAPRLKSIAYGNAPSQDLWCPRLPLSRNDVISIHDPSNENIIASAIYLHQRECRFIPDPLLLYFATWKSIYGLRGR